MPYAQQSGTPAGPYPMAVQYLTPPKSAALAVFFTFLWLGMGHLYVGRIGAGIAFALIDLVLVFLAFTGIGFIVAFPLWCLLFIIAAPLAAIAAGKAGHAVPLPYIMPPGR